MMTVATVHQPYLVELPLSETVGQSVCALKVHEACGIRWDALDVVRFLSKCSWETQNIGGKIRRCLIWRGAKSRGGKRKGRTKGNKQWYGSFWVKDKTVRAHKFAAVALHGLRPGPDDEIDHNCYNTLCVFCLECVPKAVNQARIRLGKRDASGELSTSAHESNGHASCRCSADLAGRHTDITDAQ